MEGSPWNYDDAPRGVRAAGREGLASGRIEGKRGPRAALGAGSKVEKEGQQELPEEPGTSKSVVITEQRSREEPVTNGAAAAEDEDRRGNTLQVGGLEETDGHGETCPGDSDGSRRQVGADASGGEERSLARVG